MYYQLPNGKTVWLEISDVLNLTDQDIRDLIACNAGEHLSSPWHGSSVNIKDKFVDEEDEESEDEDGKQTLRRVDPKDIMMESDDEPQDTTFSDAIHVEAKPDWMQHN